MVTNPEPFSEGEGFTLTKWPCIPALSLSQSEREKLFLSPTKSPSSEVFAACGFFSLAPSDGVRGAFYSVIPAKLASAPRGLADDGCNFA